MINWVTEPVTGPQMSIPIWIVPTVVMMKVTAIIGITSTKIVSVVHIPLNLVIWVQNQVHHQHRRGNFVTSNIILKNVDLMMATVFHLMTNTQIVHFILPTLLVTEFVQHGIESQNQIHNKITAVVAVKHWLALWTQRNVDGREEIVSTTNNIQDVGASTSITLVMELVICPIIQQNVSLMVVIVFECHALSICIDRYINIYIYQ